MHQYYLLSFKKLWNVFTINWPNFGYKPWPILGNGMLESPTPCLSKVGNQGLHTNLQKKGVSSRLSAEFCFLKVGTKGPQKCFEDLLNLCSQFTPQLLQALITLLGRLGNSLQLLLVFLLTILSHQLHLGLFTLQLHLRFLGLSQGLCPLPQSCVSLLGDLLQTRLSILKSLLLLSKWKSLLIQLFL